MRFLLQFNNILVYVLLAAGFIKLMMGLWIDASIILGVVVINGLLGFIQEGKAENLMDDRNLLSAEARRCAMAEPPDSGWRARAGRHRFPDPATRSRPMSALSTSESSGQKRQLSPASLFRRTNPRPVSAGRPSAIAPGWLIRNSGCFRSRHWDRRGDWKRNRVGAHQSVACGRQRSGNPAAASD
jgi:hypothetical protein